MNNKKYLPNRRYAIRIIILIQISFVVFVFFCVFLLFHQLDSLESQQNIHSHKNLQDKLHIQLDEAMQKNQVMHLNLPRTRRFRQITQPTSNIMINETIIPVVVSPSKISSAFGKHTALLIIASNRPEYLSETLNLVIQYHPQTSLPIIISEDGSNAEVLNVIQKFQRQFESLAPNIPFLHIKHPYNEEMVLENGYVKLSGHFKWAFTQVFDNLISGLFSFSIEHLIVLEEDLRIAVDFYEYFAAMIHFLDNDPTIYAVSAWNDNGQLSFVKNASSIYRSDFFPGLGWMLHKHLWKNELEIKWPKGYWDDWMREPAQRKDRFILRPEICRTFHFGFHGVSNAQFNDFLRNIKLNEKYIHFLDEDLSYLQKETWDNNYLSKIKNAQQTSLLSYKGYLMNQDVKDITISYDSLDEGSASFVAIAQELGIMDNIKANVPRTAYKGIVSIWLNDRTQIHIAPKSLL